MTAPKLPALVTAGLGIVFTIVTAAQPHLTGTTRVVVDVLVAILGIFLTPAVVHTAVRDHGDKQHAAGYQLGLKNGKATQIP